MSWDVLDTGPDKDEHIFGEGRKCRTCFISCPLLVRLFGSAMSLQLQIENEHRTQKLRICDKKWFGLFFAHACLRSPRRAACRL